MTVKNPHRTTFASWTDEQYDGMAAAHRHLHPDKPKPGLPTVADCTCFMDCGRDSHSGTWHQHEEDPCPLHPNAATVG